MFEHTNFEAAVLYGKWIKKVDLGWTKVSPFLEKTKFNSKKVQSDAKITYYFSVIGNLNGPLTVFRKKIKAQTEIMSTKMANLYDRLSV